MEKDIKDYIPVIRDHISRDFHGMYRDAGGAMKYPFLTPGSKQYDDVLWDWDCWLSDVALRQVLLETGNDEECERAWPYEQGSVQNYLDHGGMDGYIPIVFGRKGFTRPENVYNVNMHKPCLAQHAAFLVKQTGSDAEWLREHFYFLQTFVNKYHNHHRHSCGLYFWENDTAIGVDNDPCTFFRPARSSGSIFLNCMMYKELRAMVYLCERLDLDEIGAQFQKDANDLKAAITEYCWDEWTGFYYSVDLNLLPVRRPDIPWENHPGQPRDWPCLIQRIGVWSGFLALWAGIASKEQASRIVEEHYKNEKTFNAPFGIRTLSKMEKMYNLKASGNPSSWLGPIWGISNYLTFRGLVKYGFEQEARELCEKTIHLFGRDFERFGALHEYYQPENGEPILNRGFQNWNFLVLNMAAWYENKPHVEEF